MQTNNHHTRLLLTALVALGALAPAARAQVRSWVSGVGDDANPCSRTAPCKTFFKAYSITQNGGEVNALDPGGYGAFTISKPITISGQGTFGGITTSGTNGIIINAGASDSITIQNLSINGVGTGIDGIKILAAGAVHLDHLRINNFTGKGINIQAPPNTIVTVRDVIIVNCATGVSVDSNSTTNKVTLERVSVHECATGLAVVNGAKVLARESDFSSNSAGVSAAGSGTALTLEGVTIAHATTALSSADSASVRLSNTTVVDNTTGLSVTTGGAIVSFVNNRIFGNGTNGAPTQSFYQR